MTASRGSRIGLLLPVAAILLAAMPAPARGQDHMTAERWREDLAYLVRELDHRHPDPFHAVDRATFEAATAHLNFRIPELSDHEVIVEMARLLALVGEAHTYVALPTDGPLAFRRYPIRLERFRDGLFITDADSVHARAIGAQVVAIGSMPIEEAWDRIEPVINRDNPMTVRYLAPFRMAIPEVLHATGVIREPGTADFVIEKDGRRDTLHLEPVAFPPSLVGADASGETHATEAASETILFWKDPDRNYWFERLPGHRAIYFQFNSVREDPDDPFPVFVERLEAALAEPGAERLVIDLRRNTGGGWALTIPLFRALIRHGFDEPGRLLVLTGPATISAATVVAVELDRWLDPVYLGLPSGSSPNQYGDIVFFELPNSGIRAGYAAGLFQTAGYGTADPWVVPDVAIDMTSADYFGRRDPVLPAALDYEAGPPLEETLGQAFDEGGLPAVIAAHEAYAADPRHAYLDTERALRQLGDRLVDEDRLDHALGVHRYNVEVHPERARGYYGLASAQLAAGGVDEARQSFTTALDRLAGDPSLYPALRIVNEAAIREELAELEATGRPGSPR